MSKKRILLSVAAGFCVIMIGLVLFTYYQFTRSFRIELTPQETTSMMTALKGAMGEAIFTGHQQLSATDKPATSAKAGLIEAFKKDPEKFKCYADMMDTAMNAKKVGDVLLRQDNARPPKTSDLLGMDAKERLDAWGNPFCILPVRDRLAIISGGPSHLACDALPITAEQIANSNRTLYAGPRDTVVVTLSQSAANR